MAGSGYIDLGDQRIPLARFADQIAVFRLIIESSDLSDDFSWKIEPLPNIVCTAITYREGAHPPTAQFRYVFATELLTPDYPTRFHHVYGNRVQNGPGIVRIDDRIVVVRIYDNGDYDYLFDGFVTSPEVSVSGDNENVILTAMGTPVREWDFTLPGAYWVFEYEGSDGEFKKDKDGNTIYPGAFTDEPARFNPLGQKNMAFRYVFDGNGNPDKTKPAARWQGQTYFKDVDFSYFTSITQGDRNQFSLNAPQYNMHWSLAQAAQYVVGMGIEWPFNPNTAEILSRLRPRWMKDMSMPYVSVYDIKTWDRMFSAIIPADEKKPINLDDPASFKLVDIKCPDIEVTGDAWPHALERMIVPFGFHFRFDLRKNPNQGQFEGLPEWILTCYRIDDPSGLTDIYLQDTSLITYDPIFLEPPSQPYYDPAKTNVAALHISHEATGVANEFDIDTDLRQYEATFVLAPAFPHEAADANDLTQWVGEHVDPNKRHYYRRFIFGESGETLYQGTNGYVLDPAVIDLLWGVDVLFDENNEATPARRRRRPYGHLFSQMPNGQPYFNRLYISSKAQCGFPDTTPRLWEPGGKWTLVSATPSYRLLEDQIGIEITCEDPNNWMTGLPKEGDTDVFESQGRINLVEWLSAQGDNTPVLALTCCIYSDHDLGVIARKRNVSPTQFAIRRKVDCRDRFKAQAITKFSMIGTELDSSLADNGVKYVRDDWTTANDLAEGYRRAHECGQHAGRVEIRRITLAYNVGMSIMSIVGRDVSLQVNNGADKNESPIYPRIAAMTWQFEPEQTTLLDLTDERADPLSKRVALQLRQKHMRHQS